jgi:hypothetical protein
MQRILSPSPPYKCKQQEHATFRHFARPIRVLRSGILHICQKPEILRNLALFLDVKILLPSLTGHEKCHLFPPLWCSHTDMHYYRQKKSRQFTFPLTVIIKGMVQSDKNLRILRISRIFFGSLLNYTFKYICINTDYKKCCNFSSSCAHTDPHINRQKKSRYFPNLLRVLISQI